MICNNLIYYCRYCSSISTILVETLYDNRESLVAFREDESHTYSPQVVEVLEAAIASYNHIDIDNVITS